MVMSKRQIGKPRIRTEVLQDSVRGDVIVRRVSQDDRVVRTEFGAGVMTV